MTFWTPAGAVDAAHPFCDDARPLRDVNYSSPVPRVDSNRRKFLTVSAAAPTGAEAPSAIPEQGGQHRARL
jgi:hypothetical protein